MVEYLREKLELVLKWVEISKNKSWFYNSYMKKYEK